MKQEEKTETRHHPCPYCGKITKQTAELYNPNDPKGGEVWCCVACKENIEWVTKRKPKSWK